MPRRGLGERRRRGDRDRERCRRRGGERDRERDRERARRGLRERCLRRGGDRERLGERRRRGDRDLERPIAVDMCQNRTNRKNERPYSQFLAKVHKKAASVL